jgi:hypothetical protein
LEEFISCFSLLIDLKGASWTNLGLNCLLKVLHLQPLNDVDGG